MLLNHELLRSSLAAWREAIVITTQDAPGARTTGGLQELVQVLNGAIQKTDGCLAVLVACDVDFAEMRAFDDLVAEFRGFRSWLDQGLKAASIMQTSDKRPPPRRK